MPAIPSEPAEALAASVRRRFGANARIENFKQATLGGSNRTILFDVVEGASRRRLVSREEPSPARQTLFCRRSSNSAS